MFEWNVKILDVKVLKLLKLLLNNFEATNLGKVIQEKIKW
jgi:hypothetical protein